MKKYIYSLFACMLTLFLSMSSVSATNSYDTNKILDACDKVKAYYLSKNEIEENNYFKNIIAMESIGIEVEDTYDISNFSSKIYTESASSLATAILSAKLLQSDPTNISLNGSNVNLVELLENKIEQTGYLGNKYDGTDVYAWVLLALESVNSSQVETVANYLIELQNEDNNGFGDDWGSEGNWYDFPILGGSSNADTTSIVIEALYFTNNDKYADVISKAKSYLISIEQQGAFGYANADSQALSLEALSILDRSQLFDDTYVQNEKNPIDVLLDFQVANEGGFLGYYGNGSDEYATQDAARSLGTIRYGSFMYKILNKDYPELQRIEDNKTAEQPQQSQQTLSPATNTETKSVKTGDDTDVKIFISMSVVSGGLFLVLRKEYERVH